MHLLSLLGWLHDPSPVRGIRFATGAEGWDMWSYARLAEMTREVAAGLAAEGVQPGGVVSLLGRSGPEFVAAFFGTLLAGATPSPIAPPLAFGDAEAYRDHLRALLNAAKPALVVTDADLVADVEALGAGTPPVRTAASLRRDARNLSAAPMAPEAIALLQFTSGSSGTPRGVRISRAALEWNVAAIRQWLQWTPDDAFASWLPLHHDMGLVGALISSVVTGADLWLLQPEQFIRSPLRYLECLGTAGARLSVMPAFGLDYIVRRVAPATLDGLDFSGVRGIVVGAERIHPATLDAFTGLLGPAGLRRDTLLAAYGLAEATLAVTGLPVGEGWSGVHVESASLDVGARIVAGDDTGVVGCGRPLAGVSVTVVDVDERPLADGHVGEVVVRAPSLAAGYAGADEASSARIAGGALRTGDAGFIIDGQLFVLGRLGDGMKVRGRMVFSEDLEAALAGLGASRQRTAVLLGVHRGEATAVVVAEEPEDGFLQSAESVLTGRTGGARLVMVDAPRGTIPRTSSGKPRRRLLWRTFAEGKLPDAVGAGMVKSIENDGDENV